MHAIVFTLLVPVGLLDISTKYPFLHFSPYLNFFIFSFVFRNGGFPKRQFMVSPAPMQSPEVGLTGKLKAHFDGAEKLSTHLVAVL